MNRLILIAISSLFICFSNTASAESGKDSLYASDNNIINSGAATSDNILMYPNPAHGELNIVFDGMQDIKSIAIYNLIGKSVGVYKVGSTSAKLDIDSMPSGIYFIRLIDGHGRVAALRKFTHQ